MEKKSVENIVPKVTKIDETNIAEILKPNGKPLLVNFWAAWCVPCREEFPDLVEIDKEFKGKINVITISLDDLAEINRDVPKFLIEMKAEMPAYLLHTNKESEVISAISKEWQGGLPFSVLYNVKGEIVHTKQGKIKPEVVKEKILEMLQIPSADTVMKSFLLFSNEDYELGKADAQKDIINNKFIYKTAGRGDLSFARAFSTILKDKYGVSLSNRGCSVSSSSFSYDRGYNEISRDELMKRFGEDVLKKARIEAEELARNKPADVVELKIKVNKVKS